jgi:CheY-like chemotaxis protein
MTSPTPDPSPPVVLVVDDEPMMRTLLTQTLRPHYHVLAAADGEEALDLVWGMGNDVRLVVTDIKMPRLDGLGLAAELGRLDHPPLVLFVSAFGGNGDELPGPFLTKPFPPDALVSAVSGLIRRSEEQAHG